MTIVKQMELRSNIKKYFDLAFGGEVVLVPRKENKNVVILSEQEYKELEKARNNMATSPCLTKATVNSKRDGLS